MMEQAHASECHGDAILVAGVDNIVIAHRATGLSNKLYATLVGTLNVVAEGEERVRAESHAAVLGDPCLLLFHGQHLGLLLEEHLPCAVAPQKVVVQISESGKSAWMDVATNTVSGFASSSQTIKIRDSRKCDVRLQMLGSPITF